MFFLFPDLDRSIPDLVISSYRFGPFYDVPSAKSKKIYITRRQLVVSDVVLVGVEEDKYYPISTSYVTVGVVPGGAGAVHQQLKYLTLSGKKILRKQHRNCIDVVPNR